MDRALIVHIASQEPGKIIEMAVTISVKLLFAVAYTAKSSLLKQVDEKGLVLTRTGENVVGKRSIDVLRVADVDLYGKASLGPYHSHLVHVI